MPLCGPGVLAGTSNAKPRRSLEISDVLSCSNAFDTRVRTSGIRGASVALCVSDLSFVTVFKTLWPGTTMYYLFLSILKQWKCGFPATAMPRLFQTTSPLVGALLRIEVDSATFKSKFEEESHLRRWPWWLNSLNRVKHTEKTLSFSEGRSPPRLKSSESYWGRLRRVKLFFFCLLQFSCGLIAQECWCCSLHRRVTLSFVQCVPRFWAEMEMRLYASIELKHQGVMLIGQSECMVYKEEGMGAMMQRQWHDFKVLKYPGDTYASGVS